MRSSLLASFLIAMLLTGCAFEGVVVEKRSRPLPDASTIGTEGANSFVLRGPTGTSRPPITVPAPQLWTQTNGIYTLLLRDQQGSVHSQMVTAEVFANFRVGDYFNDWQLPLETSDSKGKTVAAVIDHRRHYPIAQTRRTHRKSSVGPVKSQVPGPPSDGLAVASSKPASAPDGLRRGESQATFKVSTGKAGSAPLHFFEFG